MIQKTIIRHDRIRTLSGSFGFIEHRFLREGFFQTLTHRELSLYLFLVLVADRFGLSYYSYEKICKLARLDLDEYVQARDRLIGNDLIAFDSRQFQVLSLPPKGPHDESRSRR
jgi:hypothetical protein